MHPRDGVGVVEGGETSGEVVEGDETSGVSVWGKRGPSSSSTYSSRPHSAKEHPIASTQYATYPRTISAEPQFVPITH